jgi:hypothetical protein
MPLEGKQQPKLIPFLKETPGIVSGVSIAQQIERRAPTLVPVGLGDGAGTGGGGLRVPRRMPADQLACLLHVETADDFV